MTVRHSRSSWVRGASLAAVIGSAAETATVAAQTYPGAITDLRVARGQGAIAEVWLANATTRYRHFVLGGAYEPESVVARLRDGTSVRFTLPADSVFEDRQPRLADLDGDGNDEIILVRSYLARGAALVVIGLIDRRLVIRAETPPTGRPNTWLNPAGIADFDGDGRLDVAVVQMPHVLGLLRLWTLRAGGLVEIASLPGVSNHVIGSPQLGLAAVADFDADGIADLAIPTRERTAIRFLSFRGGAREIGRAELPSPAVGDFTVTGPAVAPQVAVGLGGGRNVVVTPR